MNRLTPLWLSPLVFLSSWSCQPGAEYLTAEESKRHYDERLKADGITPEQGAKYQEVYLRHFNETGDIAASDLAAKYESGIVPKPPEPPAQAQPREESRPAASVNPGSVVGTWVNRSGTWHLKADGSGTVTLPTLNQNGTATTYLNWRTDNSSGTFSYTITRATLTGSLNCDGTYDYDKKVNKSYSEAFKVDGSTLTIGSEVLQKE